MTFDEYQALASRTMPETDSPYKEDSNIINYILGLNGEVGEVTDLVKKEVFHGHEIDSTDLIHELGDLLWYLSAIATHRGLSLHGIASRNIAKLEGRYPDGFSEEASKNRGKADD